MPAETPPQIEILAPGVKLRMLAEHPSIVTPTGIDVDQHGNVWLVACHTHFRPADYSGPARDEILVFDSDGGNRRVFYSKTAATMQIRCGPDGWVYLAERGRILRVKDSNGDGFGDLEENLAALDTVTDYPHNGLSGMAWHPDGGLLFSLGENFGKDWTLTGSDGRKEMGRGEGGVFRCSADGKGLRRIARGFWNPFGLLARSDGEIFAAENDPGSRPPCRLLQIVEGADYGFQWVYGSAPVHPFVGINGELRGTVGMVHPCGEGPCSIVELGGGVLIPSWSDHSIDYFPLKRKGASYTSERIPLLRGGDFFRPTCLVAAGEGVFYFNDWVYSSYSIHQRGRLWKLEISGAPWMKEKNDAPTFDAELAEKLRSGKAVLPSARLLELAQGGDQVLADAALTAIYRAGLSENEVRALPALDRVWAFVAQRRGGLDEDKWVRAFLDDSDPEMRFECLRWIADAVFKEFLPQVEATLSDRTVSFRLFEAALAAWNTLRDDPGAGVTNVDVLLGRLHDPSSPAATKAYALRLLPPDEKKLTTDLLRQFAASDDKLLQLEAIRSLAARKESSDFALDEQLPSSLRAEAVVGVADLGLLRRLTASSDALVREEAHRALRLTDGLTPDPARPPADRAEAWLAMLDSLPGQANPEAGRRVFFHPTVALCSGCHRHSGRGNVLGPDLTFVSRQGDRLAILRSILEPQREVAPQYYPSLLELKDGSTFTGILLRSSSTEVFRDLTGKERSFREADVLKRTELKTSLMPPGLVNLLTNEELRDLLAFLTQGN